MTLEEVIKTNEDTRAFHLLRKEYKAARAIKLGIEALIAFRDIRQTDSRYATFTLPGETKEE
ncbi:MAG: hypothetical protein HWN68_10900 [Desulfobacterales bacterium]|nr:hypothetical protein [Desulfobacterales bacterium]